MKESDGEIAPSLSRAFLLGEGVGRVSTAAGNHIHLRPPSHRTRTPCIMKPRCKGAHRRKITSFAARAATRADSGPPASWRLFSSSLVTPRKYLPFWLLICTMSPFPFDIAHIQEHQPPARVALRRLRWRCIRIRWPRPDGTDRKRDAGGRAVIFSQVNCIRFAYYFYNMKITLPAFAFLN